MSSGTSGFRIFQQPFMSLKWLCDQDPSIELSSRRFITIMSTLRNFKKPSTCSSSKGWESWAKMTNFCSTLGSLYPWLNWFPPVCLPSLSQKIPHLWWIFNQEADFSQDSSTQTDNLSAGVCKLRIVATLKKQCGMDTASILCRSKTGCRELLPHSSVRSIK